MKLHLLTVGEPKLSYAKAGWEEYLGRLKHYHQLRVTHLNDKKAYDPTAILEAAGNAYKVGLIIAGKNFSSPDLSAFLDQKAQEGQEVCFIIGGPEGLPQEVQEKVDLAWSFSRLTFPHDLAMVVLAETLYRASTISAGQPYHK
jgi:23S rRNA (pseudouridine1915-N3)-methyltransferase